MKKILLLLLFIPNLYGQWYTTKAGSDENGNGSEENPFLTIQKAVDFAIEGDTIFVSEGLYVENIYMEKGNITMIGAGIQKTVIDASQTHENEPPTYGRGITVNFQGMDFFIEGFSVINSPRSGIEIRTPFYSETIFNNATIRNCEFKNNGHYGIFINGFMEDSVLIQNNIIHNNWVGIELNTVWAYLSGGNKIINNVISNNTVHGISLGHAELINNIISNNGGYGYNNGDVPGSIEVQDDICQSRYNIFWNNSEGDWRSDHANVVVGDLSVDPNFNLPYDTHCNVCIDFGDPSEEYNDPFSTSLNGIRNDIGNYGGPFANTMLKANIGPDKSNNVGFGAQIISNHSSYQNGYSLTYNWSQSINNPELIDLPNGYTEQNYITFTPQEIGDYTFGLSIQSNNEYSLIDTMIMSVLEFTGNVFYVSSDSIASDSSAGTENNPFATIQNAINACVDGDIIFVDEGTYYENINFNGRSISIIGENVENTKIIGNQNETVVWFDVGGSGPTNALLKNITLDKIDNSEGGYSPIIHAEGTFTIDSCLIFGEVFFYGPGDTLKNSTIYSNQDTAVYLHTEGHVITNSIIFSEDGYVIAASDNESSNYTINNNCLFSPLGFIDFSLNSTNIISNPLFCDIENDNFTLASNSPALSNGENNLNIGVLGVGCDAIITSSIDVEVIPEVFILLQNYPNPFNPITSLRYDLLENGLVNITIYDMMGRIVKTLVNGFQTAGFKSVQWNAINDRNEPVSAGLYIYTIQAGEFRQTKKMVLLK